MGQTNKVIADAAADTDDETATTEGTEATGGDGATTEAGTDEKDWRTDLDLAVAEVEKWKGLSRKHEDNAKKYAPKAKKWDEHETASKSDADKAIDTARTEARAEALRESGQKAARSILSASLKAAKVNDVDDILDDLNLAKFVDDDGEINQDAIDKAIARFSPSKPGAPSAEGQGEQGGQINDGKETSADDLVKAIRARK